MKILHISTFPFGGAFNGAYRLHLALLKNGISSKMLVREKPNNSKLKGVYFYNETSKSPNLFNKISTRLGFPITADQKRGFYTKGLKGKYENLSFPFSDYDITETQEYKDADIIHLHWVAEYLDYETFFKKCRKPILITLRDLNQILGIFHYEGDKNYNDLVFGSLEKRFMNLKISSLKKFNGSIKVIGISDWVAEKSKCSVIFKGFQHYTIHNCINVESYELFDKKKAQEYLNIPDGSIVFSFVSDNTANKRKGLDILLEAITNMPNTNNLIILTVGNGCSIKFPLNIIHRHLGKCNQSELNIIYCASDAFIFSTREEALGNVMLEAMACGTPVIGTPVGGLIDVIIPGFNGIFSKDVSAEGLKVAIIEFIKIKDQFDSVAIRKYIADNFNEKLIAGKYIEVYNKILPKN